MITNKNLEKTYAIFVRNSYGDLLMTAPLIKYIKTLNNKNKITLFVDNKNFQLVRFMEGIENFFIIPSKGNKYLLFIYYGLKYRKNNYDVSIAAKTGIGSSNGFFPFFLGAKKRIAYVSKNKKWTDKLVNYPVIYSEDIYDNQHYALSVLHLLENRLKSVPKKLYPSLNIKLKSSNIKPKLLVSVSNNRASSLLDINKIALIINRLSVEFDLEIYISALENDKDLAIKLQSLIFQKSQINITPLLEEFILFIKEMDLCFFGDGGSMHIAAALGISQVVLFGETSEITWSPLSDNSTILRDELDVNNIPINKILKALKSKLIALKKNSLENANLI